MKKARATKREKKRLWKTFIIIKNNQIKELKLQNRQLDQILCDKIHDLNGYQQDLLSMQRAYDGIRKAFNEIQSKHDRLQVENEKLKKENYDLKDKNLKLELKLLQFDE